MAVAFDSIGAGSGTVNSPSGASWSHTIGASATVLLVAIGGYTPSYGYTSLSTHTVTVGSTPLTQLGITDNAAAGLGWIELWGLINPPTGAQTITVVEMVGSTPATINCESASYTGATKFGNTVVNAGVSTALTSGGIVSATGNRVVSAQGVWSQTLSAASGTSRYNQPTSSNYVALLIEDAPGAATVTQTSTASASSYWGTVSVDLKAGTQWHVNASLALSTTPVRPAVSVTGRAWTVNASLALGISLPTTGTGQALGPPLRYVGRAPDSDSTIVTKAYALTDDAANEVTSDFITNQIAIAAQNLVNQTWIDEQVADYATQTDVTTALAAYVPHTQLGVPNGLAQSDSTGLIPSGQLPTLVTNRVAKAYDIATTGTLFLGPGTSRTVTTTSVGEYVLATMPIADPGYPWIPWAFAYVQGFSSGAPSGSRLLGNNNIGLLAVTPLPSVGNTLFAAGVCTDDTRPNYYTCVPGAITGATPATIHPILGPLTLQLSACNLAGNGYTFKGDGLVWHVVVLPALGTGAVP